MEPTNKTEELKKIFLFLAGKDDNQDNLKRKTENIIYGLDHYGLKMNQEKKDDLKNALINKTDNYGNIDFEDFKECFDLKKKDKKKKAEEIENTANQLFFLIQEILGPKEIKNHTLSKENLKQIFEIVFCLDEPDNNFLNKDSNINDLNNNNISINAKIDQHNKTHISNNLSRVLKAVNKNNIQTPTPVDKEEEDFARKLKHDFLSEKNDLAKMLVDCIDLDGDGVISLSDFEFLIKSYFASKG